MKPMRNPRSWRGPALALRAVALLAFATPACRNSAPPPDSTPARAAASDVPAALAPPPSDSYVARLEAGPCAVGSPCTATVVLEARGEYHINDKFPYKFRPEEQPSHGLAWSKPVFAREDGQFGEKQARLPVSFVVEDKGPVKLAGVFSLSVCSSATCLMDKQALETTVEVR